MTEAQINFYFNLGLLATEFSKMEERVRWILVVLISPHEPTTALYAIEKNAFAINLELIKKVNELKNFYREQIGQLVEQMKELTTTRNQFIHGVWDDPKVKDGEMYIEVSEGKVKKEEDDEGTNWYPTTKRTFTLLQIKDRIEKIRKINTDLQQWAVQFYAEYYSQDGKSGVPLVKWKNNPNPPKSKT